MTHSSFAAAVSTGEKVYAAWKVSSREASQRPFATKYG